jgi:sporulation protein YlmC with PRC-barrel domain
MKNFQIFRIGVFITLLSFVSMSVFAQANYKQSFNIHKDGKIMDNKGKSVGLVTKDQIIKDHEGHKIAFVDGEGNLIDAKTNKKMGRMGKDGKSYYNAKGELMFTIKDNPDETCDIVDTKGKVIGNVHDSFKGSACAIHCFQNNMAKKADGSRMKH